MGIRTLKRGIFPLDFNVQSYWSRRWVFWSDKGLANVILTGTWPYLSCEEKGNFLPFSKGNSGPTRSFNRMVFFLQLDRKTYNKIHPHNVQMHSQKSTRQKNKPINLAQRSPLQLYRDNEDSVTPTHEKLDGVLIRADQSPPIHHVCLRTCEERSGRQLLRVDRQLLHNPLCGAAASLGWPLPLNIETSAVNKRGYGLQLHPSKWRHYMWNGAERRANRLSTVTSEGPVTCRASLLYKRVSLCPHGHKHLCVLNSIVPLTGKCVA